MESINSQLIEVIFTISRLMKDQMACQSDFSTLSFLQIQALIFVLRHKKVQMSNIAEHFNIELPSATSLIQKLVKEDLVERKADKDDRRIVNVLLTANGKKLLKKTIAQRAKRIETSLSLLNENEKKQLLKILQKILKKMEETNEK